MWKPQEDTTYLNSVTEQELTVTETPNTSGEPTRIAENRMVLHEDEDGIERARTVVWWNKRRNCMEIVE